jgi:hypothetical protein
MASTRVAEPMYLANPVYDTESLLANASESLGSVTEMLNNFAAVLDTAHRKTALGIAQIVMLTELAVNQALDNVQPTAKLLRRIKNPMPAKASDFFDWAKGQTSTQSYYSNR